MARCHPLGPHRAGRALTRQAAGAASKLMLTLGHDFTNPDLLDRALTHASATAAQGPDNERMEFLGDRVLGLVIADALLTRFPSASEGELAPRLNRLVRRQTCAAVARDLDLGRFVHMAPAEEAQGGRAKPAILGNAMEAVIAALYLDGGLVAAQTFILSAWAKQFEAVATIPRDAKTQVQEKLHTMGHSHPDYRVVSQAGSDHAPVFEVEVDAGAAGSAVGSGPSKRAAEQAAAAALLTVLESSS